MSVPETKREFMEWKYADSQVKITFWAQQSVKVIMTVFWTIKGPNAIDLPKKVQLWIMLPNDNS